MFDTSQGSGTVAGEESVQSEHENPDRIEAVGEAIENVFGGRGTPLEHFSMPEFRPHQRETIEEINDAFERGYRYVLVQAPTGSGKSRVAEAFAFASDNAYIITPQKILQDQYRRDFPNMEVMKGRSAYTAAYQHTVDTFRGGIEYSGPEITCQDCICRKIKDVDRTVCPYNQAIITAQTKPVVVHNFDSFMYQNLAHASKGGLWPGRKLLIVDECHAIENKLMDFVSFTISNRDVAGLQIPRFDIIEQYDDFLEDVYQRLAARISRLRALVEEGLLADSELKELDNLTRLFGKIGMFQWSRKGQNPVEYVFDYTGSPYQSVSFKPVTVGSFAYRNLFCRGERLLLMGATVLDKEMFCQSVGLNPSEVYYVDVESFFPVDNHRVVHSYVGPMSFRHIDRNLPSMVDKIEDILDRFPNTKGIIQTHSEKIAKYIQENLKNERLTFNKDFPTPQEMLEFHSMKDASVIVASGLREGIDLYGDLSQLQIFCKVPYPSLADKQVKRRMEIDKRWYGFLTTMSFVQALGRSIRSSDDKAVTYLLDGDFKRFYGMCKQYFPTHIRRAVGRGHE